MPVRGADEMVVIDVGMSEKDGIYRQLGNLTAQAC